MKRILAMVLLIIVLVVVVTVPFIIWGDTRFTFFSNQEKGITDFLLASLELIGLVVSIAIVFFILYQYIRYRPYRLVFDAFPNELTLAKTNEDKPLNLSILAKEELVHQFKIIFFELLAYKKQSEKEKQDFEAQVADVLYNEDISRTNMEMYVSVDQIKKSRIIEDLEEVFKILTDPEDINLMNLVGEITPKEVTPFMKFIEAIFPPHIIKATGYLQSKSDIPGITFEFADIGNQRNLMVRTLWQPSNHIEDSPDKATVQYIELLRQAMHWVAVTFWEQKLIFHVPFRNRIFTKYEKRRQARIYYLLGALYTAYADQFEAYKPFFRQLAVEHLRQASDIDSNWCLPSLYLANLYCFKAIETTEETKSELREKLLNEALRLYKEALNRAKRKKASIYTQQRIKLAKALAELESDNDELIEKATKVVLDITVNEGPASPAKFDPKRTDCAAYLYNLARWYELSLEKMAGVPKAKDEARRYLTYSLARSQSLWDNSFLDKHFIHLHDDGDLKVLKEELGKKLSEERKLEKELGRKLSEESKLETMTGDNFKTEIDMILKRVDQKLKRPRV